MVERFTVALLLIAIGLVVYRGLQWRTLRHVRRQGPGDVLLAGYIPGRPAIVYFTSENCAACKLQQQPVLHQLQQLMVGNGLQIIQVDVDLQRADAERWGVMSLPTTFVLDCEGKALSVNYGVASMQKLRHQLELIS